jgi:hypothetical protein
MQAVVTHPGGVRQGVESAAALAELPEARDALERVVLPSRSLLSEERLAIYSNMFVWRLVDILREDFPSTAHALGERYYDTAHDFLTRHPPRHPSLNYLGRSFARYLREEAESVEAREFVAELAELERAIEETFAAQKVEPVALDELLAIPMQRWGEARLATIPALRLMRFEHPLDDYVRAVRAGEAPAQPAPATERLVVWRSNWTVWRLVLSEAQFALLSALHRGLSLGQAIEHSAALESVDEGELARVGDWFREWTAEGMFARVELD